MYVHEDPGFDARCAVSSDVAVAEVGMMLPTGYFHAEGTAKRAPGDSPDNEVAELLAYGRALELLAHRVLKQAHGRVKHNDDVRADRKRRAHAKTVLTTRRAAAAKARAAKAAKATSP